MNNEKFEILDKSLSKVNDWLKFAETKNGVLIAVESAVLFGIFRVVAALDSVDILLSSYLILFSILTISSILISLTSFIPRLEPPFWIKMEKKSEHDNPLFFGHACKYSKLGYLELFDKKLSRKETGNNGLEIELCDQIVNNSKIAFIKYKMFSIAIWIFLGAILTPVGAYIMWRVKV